MNSIRYFCSLCNLYFTSNGYTEEPMSCYPDCGNKHENLCNLCKEKIEWLHNTTYEKPNHVKINDNFNIQITYDVKEVEHDGYCSEGENSTEKIYIKTITYPLVDEITNKNKENLELVCDKNILEKYYYGPCESYGNGMCECGKYYYISKAVIIKK